jgi:hypothetical protein
MSDSKEVSKTIITSRALVLRPEKNSGNSAKAKEGILLVCLALVIMAFAYLFYSGGFGGGLFGNANGDGICQSTENCADNPGDCLCAAGKDCSLNEKICVDSNMPALIDDSQIMPAAQDDILPVPESIDIVPAEEMPASVTLSNCIYDQLKGVITCDANCQSDTNGNTTIGVTDSNGTLAIAREAAIPIKMGNIFFSPGKVEFQALHVEVMGGVISYSFSELDQDISKWNVFISCNNPPGSASLEGVIKLQ